MSILHTKSIANTCATTQKSITASTLLLKYNHLCVVCTFQSLTMLLWLKHTHAAYDNTHKIPSRSCSCQHTSIWWTTSWHQSQCQEYLATKYTQHSKQQPVTPHIYDTVCYR